MIHITLLGNRVHLRRMQAELKTESGILLLEKYQDDRSQYLVLGVGPGRKLKKTGELLPPEVKAGDYVLVPRIQDSVTLSDGSFIVHASQIWAKWSHEEAVHENH